MLSLHSPSPLPTIATLCEKINTNSIMLTCSWVEPSRAAQTGKTSSQTPLPKRCGQRELKLHTHTHTLTHLHTHWHTHIAKARCCCQLQCACSWKVRVVRPVEEEEVQTQESNALPLSLCCSKLSLLQLLCSSLCALKLSSSAAQMFFQRMLNF